MITAQVVGRSMIPPWTFPEDMRNTPEDTLFHDMGGGLWMADPEFWAESTPARSCMMAIEITTTEETTVTLQIKTDTEPLRKMVHPLIGTEADCGLALLVQALDMGGSGDMLFMGIWGGFRDWEDVTIDLPPGAAGIVVGAVDYPALMLNPELPWPAAPEGHTPTNLIHIRNLSISPVPYGSPGFDVFAHPAGPERMPVGMSVMSILPHDCGMAQGRISQVGRQGLSVSAPQIIPGTITDMTVDRQASSPASWRNPYPPGIAVPATSSQHSTHGLAIKLTPDAINTVPAIVDIVFPAGGQHLRLVMQVHPGQRWHPHHWIVGLQRIRIDHVSGGVPVTLADWDAGIDSAGLQSLPTGLREYVLPVLAEGESTIRVTAYPNPYSAGIAGWLPEVAVGGMSITDIKEAAAPAIVARTLSPSPQWQIPPADAATAQVIYTCTLSGAEAGLPDLDIPMTSFACRLRTATPSYLSVTVPSRHGLSAEIAARASGTLRVFKGYRLTSGYMRSEEIARGKYNRMSSAGGGRSSSLTLVGYHRYGEGAGTLRTLREVMVDGNDMEGRRTVRAAVDMWMRPGDVATWEGQTMTVGSVAIHVSVERATMDLTEA